MKLKSILILCILIKVLPAFAVSDLDEYFRLQSEGNEPGAQQVLINWKPTSFEEISYKKYFLSLSSKKANDYWKLYQEISKNRKLFKLQHESIRKIIEMDLLSKKSIVKDFYRFAKVAKQVSKNLRSYPEGVEFEGQYLKWILKNHNNRELCNNERSRWLSQVNLSLSEIIAGLEGCPVKYDDFIYRIRMLIFSGEEKKALDEIVEFSDLKKLSGWENAYLRAIYFSNIGDPTSAFGVAIPFEMEIKNNQDYSENLFYIAQRAGELTKAEELINYIINSGHKKKKKKDLIFQKAFLFYQTRRYAEANKYLKDLIGAHPSHNKKVKSKEYDELTWLSAWCSYLANDFQQAEDAFTKNKKWTSDKARNQYWLAQTEMALGNPIQAVSYFRQLALPVLNGKAFGYYNYLGWLRFENNKIHAASDLVRTQINSINIGRGSYEVPDLSTDPADLLEEYDSYFNAFGSTDDGEVQIVNQNEMAVVNTTELKGIQAETPLQLKNQMSWADSLTRWGYTDLAKWHLLEVEKTLKSKTSIEPLIEYYNDKKYYNRALHLASDAISSNGKNLSRKDEPLLWGSLYPKAYENAVEQEAKKRQLHPYLLWSIMKAETQYKADAISPVGAIGLMQFMPYTAKKVAIMLNEEHRTKQLFEPDSAIKYGAMYLKKLSDELGGQYPLVAAAYNGGPHRVKLWLKNFRGPDNSNMDYDVFIEHIPFNETRTYVKRVVNYILTYQKIYEEKLDIKSSKWILEKIPYKLKEPILLKEEWPFEK